MSSSEIDTGVSSHEDELVRAELDEARRKRRTGRARIVGTLISVAVIGAVFAFALPRIADYGDVWDEIRKLSWQWLVVLGLATILNRRRRLPRRPAGQNAIRRAAQLAGTERGMRVSISENVAGYVWDEVCVSRALEGSFNNSNPLSGR